MGWPRLATAWLAVLGAVAGLWASPREAAAQTDEIQVYNGDIAAPGVLSLTLHNNYTPSGGRIPAFPGAVVPDHSLNGVPEWAYGVTDWMEAGLYLPLYTLQPGGKAQLDGFKVRALFAVPDAAKRTFFYGLNFEFSVNARRWDPKRYTSEIRPILGWRFGKVEFIVNPSLDNSYLGFSRLDFAPATRLAYNISETWAVGAEEYADLGPLRAFEPRSRQTHQLFGVVDFNGAPVNVEFGAGFGLTPATDRFVVKLILSKDIWSRRPGGP